MKTNLYSVAASATANLCVGSTHANTKIPKSFKYVASLLCLLMLGIGNAWGFGHDKHTATLNVYKGTGSGTVYASTSSTATTGSASASFNCGEKEDGQHTGTLYAYATPASGYTFLGWTTSASSSAGADNSNPKGVAFNVTDGSSTQTLYAHFVEKAKVNITFEAPANGTYTIKVNGGSTETVSSADVVKSNVEGVVLTATPASGYTFAGWYKLNSAGKFVEDLSIANPYNASFTVSETIKMGARFVPTTLGKFILKGSSTEYYGLKAATVAAGGSGIIVPVAEETLVDGSDLMPFDNGTYTIKAGATLLVPYSSANEVQTKPKDIAYNSTGWTKALSIYKKLKLGEGVNINVLSGGVICVGGQLVSYNGGNPSAYPIGACGVIDMSSGGHIELNGTLYCWGFIKGQDMDQGNNTTAVGTITANNGAVIWEDFAVGDWRGGTACSTIAGKASSWKFFPFQSYTIQNVEVPTTYKYGSTLSNYTNVYGGGGKNEGTFSLIGNSNTLFLLKNASSFVRKWYDPTTDLVNYEMSGTAQLDALNVDAGITTVSSSSYNLPISSNMQIVLTNCNMTISKPMIVQPGAVIEVKNDATLTLASNAYIFDVDNWGMYCNGRYFYSMDILTNHKNRGTGTSKELLDDATLIVDGTLNVTGKLYTTAGGADIMGNGGGSVKFSDLGSSGNIVMCTGVSTNENVAIAQANMHNEDDSYTQAEASTFYNVNSRWFITGKQNINSTTHVYDEFTYISSGAVSGTTGTTTTTPALYGEDKTGLVAGMKWCNVVQDGTCPAIYNATQDLNGTAAANIRYTYQSSDWLQLLKTETEGVYGGSDNSLYALDGCTISSLGSVDENCLYTIEGVKKALVDGHFVALEKNTNDEAFHNTANTEEYYISFAGCTWHSATKYAGEEKAYIVEGGDYIWYNNDWLLVEREDPFFFDYNDQNVKRYYEYENDEWVLADPKVRVTDAIETRDFFFLPEAFAIANGKKNATITILKDITDSSTPLSYTQTNTTCTLDLNGHTVNLTITGSGTTGVNMIKIDASGSTFTITDNSAEKNGKLILKQGITTATATKRWYGIVLANGALVLNAGEIQAINDFPWSAKDNTGMMSGIYVAAGKTFTMNGGSVYAESPYYPRAIDIAGATSAKATVTLNAGTITANATAQTNAMGIYTVGGTTTIKDGVTINATTKTTSAYGIYVDASTSNYWGTVNMTGGTVNATATTTTALGAFVNGTYSFNNTTPNTIKGTYRAVLNISGGTFNVITNGTTTAYGIQSRGTTTITGGTFNVTPKTTTAHGLLVQDGTTTISGTPTFTIKGTTTAYGIYANAATPDDKTGRPYNPNVIVNGGTFDVTTTTADIAYGIYAGAGTRVITNTASGYYPGIYSSIGTVTINGGTFNVTAKTYSAIGVYVHRVAAYESGTNTAHVFRGVANIAGGTFTVRDLTHKTTTGACDGVRSYGTLTITGGTFDVAASAATAKNATYAYGVNVYDGTATVSGTPEFTVSAYGTAYGAVANGAAPDSKTGLPCAGNLTIDGGTFNVSTTTSTTAYGVYTVGPAPRVITSTADGYYPGTYYSKPVATVNGGTFNVKAKTTTAIGAYCGRGVRYDPDVLEPHTIELENFSELNIKGGTFNVSTLGTTTADGVRSFGTTNITGGTFNVTPKTTTATAIRTYAGKTTITGNPHFTVKGTTTVYGLNAGCEAPNAKSGLTYNGEIECNGGTFDLETTTGATCYGVYAYAGSVKITTLHSADADYFAGNYASAGTIVVNGGIFNVKAKTTGAYGVVVPAAVSQSGATGYPTATATAKCDINGGKFLVNGTEKYAVNKKATTANFKISGGYWGGDGVNNNLAYYAVSPNKVLTLRSSHAVYPDGYRYAVGEGGTVTWKNGTTTLLAEVYESGETPEYTGATPTKTADAQYTYTHNGWSPAVAAMENSDVTYTATFSKAENKYTVSVEAGANGAVSPASVSGIGCETASDDITATPNVGYKFDNWTLPDGVTAADGYTVASNPIHIHAVAADKTITANFVARNDINYTVKHWQQNIADDDYTEVTADQETKQGTTGATTDATAKSYTGFTVQHFEQGIIAGDGTTIVNIYYNRNKYTVTWVDGNGETIETDENVKFGATPVYNGGTPPKTGTAQYSYTFNGWYPEVSAVVGNATYTATFTETVNTYTITWRNKPADGEHEGEVLEIDKNVPYGTDPTYDGSTPEQAPTTKYVFTFRAWTPEISSVTGDTTYTADYTASVRPYPVKWVNHDGTVLKDTTHNYGWDDIPAADTYDGETPTKPAETGKNYTFIGWSEPVSVVNGGDVTYTALFGLAITADEEHPVTISGTESASVTTVKVSGKLNVSAGSLTTTDLILEATPSTSGEITGAERVNVTGHAYFDLKGVFKAHTWYAVAVPWQVDVPAYDKTKCGVLISNEGSSFVQQELGRTVDLIYYDGAERAKNGHSNACWRYIEDDNAAIHIMYPGRAYMIYLASDATVIRFKKKADASIHTSSFKVYPYSGRDRDANWNGIANPATFQAYINPNASTFGAIVNAAQIYDGDKKSFSVVNLKDYGKLVVGKPVFVQVQVPEEKTVVANPLSYEDSPSPAPRRVKEHKDMMPLEVSLVANESEKNDRIIIHMSDDKEEDTYIVGKDLMKMGVSDIIPQMWVDRYDSRLCINTVAPVNDVATYPLSLFAPKADEYTISTSATAEDNVTLYLTFDGRPIWNLTYSPYVTSLERGTTQHYGLMLVRSKAPEVATGIGDVQDGGQPTAQKIMLNGQVYILRGGELYSITGQSIK